MRRVLLGVAVLALLQGGLYLMWQARTVEETTFVNDAASGPAPTFAPRDGVLHVWATWCAPCRDELPELLAAARAEGVPLVAVSLDQNPASLYAFFGGDPPSEVIRDPDAAAAAGVKELPVTLRVVDGAIVSRVQGAREWRSEAARAWLTSAPHRALE